MANVYGAGLGLIWGGADTSGQELLGAERHLILCRGLRIPVGKLSECLTLVHVREVADEFRSTSPVCGAYFGSSTGTGSQSRLVHVWDVFLALLRTQESRGIQCRYDTHADPTAPRWNMATLPCTR